MSACSTSPDLTGRLASAEARIARLEAKLAGAEDCDDAMQIAAAARFCGYSVSNFRKIVSKDAELAKCYWRGPGAKSRLIFSRKALEAWKAARS